jgi:hypothetical protein
MREPRESISRFDKWFRGRRRTAMVILLMLQSLPCSGAR